MSFSYIRLEVDSGGVGVVTFCRPQKRNALNQAVLDDLEALLRQAGQADEVRGLVFTGEGDKAFVAGADVSELAEATPWAMRKYSRRGQRLFRQLETLGKPTIAAINGWALGGGLELALSCTLRVAAAEAKLGQPEVKLGLIPGYGGTVRLARLIGRGKALEMLLTGDPVTAEEALRLGLVNHVVPAAELLPFCRQLMAKILSNAPLALRLVMETVDAGLQMGIEEALAVEALGFAAAAATQDRSEGTRAFLEKRPPEFKGN